MLKKGKYQRVYEIKKQIRCLELISNYANQASKKKLFIIQMQFEAQTLNWSFWASDGLSNRGLLGTL